MPYKTIPKPTTELEYIILSQSEKLFEEHFIKLQEGLLQGSMGEYDLEELLTVGFFRALQVNNLAMALKLLRLEQTKAGLIKLKVQTTEERLKNIKNKIPANRQLDKDLLDLKVIKKWNYLDYLSSHLEYEPGMNITAGAKNVALLTALRLDNYGLLVKLLEIQGIKDQLSHTCIPLFMNLVMNSSGEVLSLAKLEKWKQIRVNKLLEYPLLFAYISTRWFDFSAIIEPYQEETLYLLSSVMTEEQLNNLSTNDIRQAFYILKNLIQYRLIDNLGSPKSNEVFGHIITLLNIQELSDIAHKAVSFEQDKEENYLLRILCDAIINNKTRPNAQKKLIDVAKYLIIKCQKVREIAQENDFYSNRYIKLAITNSYNTEETLLGSESPMTIPATTRENSPMPSLPSLSNFSFLSSVSSPATISTEVTTRENSPVPLGIY